MKTLILAASLAALAVPAHAYRAFDGFTVHGDASSFTVEYEPGAGASNYWCAAGDFVLRGLGEVPSTRIYRVSPRPLARGEGMTFSLLPENSTGETGIFVYPDTGDLSAAFAESFCTRTIRRHD